MASITEARPSTSPAPEGHQASVLSSEAKDSNRPTTDFQPAPPSETVQPTVETAPLQRAATHPEAGGQVTQTIITQPARRASFSQKVVGYAKEIRGTILRNPETKDYGGKIRKGEEPWPPPSHDTHDTGSAPASSTSTSPSDQAQTATP